MGLSEPETIKTRDMKKIFAMMLTASHLCGCASVFSNSAFPVYIETTPEKTAFVINNRNGVEVSHGETPATIMLESGAGYFKGAAYTIHFSKPGYEDVYYGLFSRINGWYYTNINIVGLLIDPATGAMWTLPQDVSAELPAMPGPRVERRAK
jgi:hypothetical protein